jgi:hypothetical protein
MTNPPFRTEVLRLRRWCGDPLTGAGMTDAARPLANDGRPQAHGTTEVDAVIAHLEPIRSRSSLLSSFAREASPTEPIRTAYAIRWIELGSGIPAAGVARSRRRRVLGPALRPALRSRT